MAHPPPHSRQRKDAGADEQLGVLEMPSAAASNEDGDMTPPGSQVVEQEATDVTLSFLDGVQASPAWRMK